MDKHYEVGDWVEEKLKEIWDKSTIPNAITYKIVGNSNLKTGITVKKTNDLYRFIIGTDIIFECNEDHLSQLDEESLNILVTQQVSRVYYDIEKDKLSLTKPDLETFASVLDQFGTDAVKKANQLIKLLVLQDKEKKKDEKAAKKSGVKHANVPVTENFFTSDN